MKKLAILMLSTIILTSCNNAKNKGNDHASVNLDEFYKTKPISTNISSIDLVTSDSHSEKISKIYNSLDELEKDLNLNFLHSNFFNESDYDAIYLRDGSTSNVYLFKENLNPYYLGVGHLDLDNDRTLIIKISWIDNPNQKPYSVELMGGSEIIENYDVDSTNVSIIKERRGDKTLYSGIFKFNDMTYYIKNSNDLDVLKEIIQDLLESKKGWGDIPTVLF